MSRSFFKMIWHTLFATWRRLRAADGAILASSLAFTTVISLVPLLAVSLSVFKAYGGFDTLMKYIEPLIMENLVEASGANVSQFIKASVRRIESRAMGITGVAGLLLSSTKVFLDMETAIRRVWQEKDGGIQWRRLLVYWTVMFLGPLALAVALGLVGSKGLDVVKHVPKNTVAFVCIFGGFYCINKLVPMSKVSQRAALTSALFAAIGIVIAQHFYGVVTKNVLGYSKIYGSLASIPIFLIWILVLWWIALASVSLCATLEIGLSRRRRTAPEEQSAL